MTVRCCLTCFYSILREHLPLRLLLCLLRSIDVVLVMCCISKNLSGDGAPNKRYFK